MVTLDRLMREIVEQAGPSSAPDLETILAEGRARRRRAAMAQVGAVLVAVTVVGVAGAVGRGVVSGDGLSSLANAPSPSPPASHTRSNAAPSTTVEPPFDLGRRLCEAQSRACQVRLLATLDAVARHLDPKLEHLAGVGIDGGPAGAFTLDWYDGERGDRTWPEAVEAFAEARLAGHTPLALRNGKVKLRFAVRGEPVNVGDPGDVEAAARRTWVDKPTDWPHQCAVEPRPDFTWETCDTTTLADGTNLRIGTSRDGGVQTIGVTHVLHNGLKISLSVSTAGDLLEPSNDSTGIPLDHLPVTIGQLKSAVLDPQMPTASPKYDLG
jgi:hypothetical protein